MQHARPGSGHFLRLGVVQLAQQARGRNGARVGGEEARHVRPDLQPLRLELGREVGRRRVRAAPPDEYGLRAAFVIAGGVPVRRDEALREHRAVGFREAFLQSRIGREVAVGREVARGLGPVRRAGGAAQRGARVEPARREDVLVEVGRADAGGHQLALRQRLRAEGRRRVACQREALREALERVEVRLPRRALVRSAVVHHAQRLGEVSVLLAEGAQHGRGVVAGGGRLDQLLDAVGDAAERGAHQQRAPAVVEVFARHARDGLPALRRGDAGAAEFEDDGWFAHFVHWLVDRSLTSFAGWWMVFGRRVAVA